MPCVLAVDIGTSSSKGVVVGDHDEVIASSVVHHEEQRPRPGWVGTGGLAWWRDFTHIVRELLVTISADALGFGSADIAAVGVGGMSPCVLLMDRNDTLVRPAILYRVDTCADEEIDLITVELGADVIVERCGWALTIDAWAEAASVGQDRVGDLQLMYGTTMLLIATTSAMLRTPSMWTTAGTVPGSGNLAGGLAAAGALTAWFKDMIDGDFAQLVVEAAGIPACTEPLIDEWNPLSVTILPDPMTARIYDESYRAYRQLYDATAPIVHTLVAQQHRGWS